ncbi:MAG: hypothetical protein AB2693_22105 [Candidatus Thiodiazotropha sp.]
MSRLVHLWDEIDTDGFDHNVTQHLTATLQQEWNHISLRRIKTLINSLANRIRKATRENGRYA